MTSLLYRKRPIVIEAMRYTGENITELLGWLRTSFFLDDDGNLFIVTLEGPMCARPGCYVIRGVAGEFYACDADVFDQTYELVADQEQEQDHAPR